MSEIIALSFWSGRKEYYVVPNGTAATVQALAEPPKLDDCVYFENMPAGWYETFRREHINGLIEDTWAVDYSKVALVVTQNTQRR